MKTLTKMPVKISQKRLDNLPTVRMYYEDRYGNKKWFTVPYFNADETVDLPLHKQYFTPNGKGEPFSCGVSNSAMDNKNLFNHPCYYAHTIGSATYIVCMLYKNGWPKLAVRYSHRGAPIIEAYDKSLKNQTFKQRLEELLDAKPILRLVKGRTEAGVKRQHGPTHHNPKGHLHRKSQDKNKQGLRGAALRMANAGLIPGAFVN